MSVTFAFVCRFVASCCWIYDGLLRQRSALRRKLRPTLEALLVQQPSIGILAPHCASQARGAGWRYARLDKC
eukprot:scaffold301614_cov28-Tisochrysis_lutea.AAC.7